MRTKQTLGNTKKLLANPDLGHTGIGLIQPLDKAQSQKKDRFAFYKAKLFKFFVWVPLALLFATVQLTAQSSNCNCVGNLVENPTFEGSNLTNWTASGSASANFLSGFDDCGVVSLRVSRASGATLLDPAAWQQENSIEALKTYTLSFDAGTYDPSKVAKVYMRFYNAGGALLSENYLEVNHDVDSDGQLQSYSFSMVSPASVSYARVELATQGDYLIIDNLCLVKSSCSSSTFNFQNPSLVSGPANDVGAVYQFDNVIPGTHAKVTIVSKSHSDIVIYTMDEPASSFGGYDGAFQPIIDYNWINGGGSFDPAGEKSVTFKFDFIDAVTGAPDVVSQINMTGLDIDGSTDEVREFIESSGFQSYEVQSPTSLTLSGSLKAKGALANVPNVDETALHAMISYVFNDVSSVTVKYGGDFNGNTFDFGDTALGNSDEKRHNSLFFKCYDFNNPTACPAVTVSGGHTICDGTSTVLTASVTSGNGTCNVQWQSSLNNSSWSNIAGATAHTYTTPNLSITTYYRATYSCSGNAYCGVVYSNVETVVVDANCIEICNNGIDDDYDGLADCLDPDCGGTNVDAGANVTLCNGAQATFTATATGGDAPFTFGWSNGLGTGATKTVTPSNTTTYIVTVTNGNNCTATDQVSVNVNQAPVANSSADVTICRYFNTNISVSATGGTTPYQYSWDNGLNGNQSSFTVNPLSTTTYSVTVTSANGCNDTEQITVTVQTCAENCSNGVDDDGDGLVDCADTDCGPSVDAGTNVNNCPGANIQIGATVSGGNGALAYIWSNGHTGQSQIVSPLITTTYTVTVTAPSGCTATDQVTVNMVACGENCTNGVDDDGDGLVDCADPDCVASSAPDLADDVYNTCPGMPYTERVTYNDNNLQNPVFSIYTNPTNGAVTMDATGKFLYTPSGNDCIVDQFMYQVCNQASGCCAQATVTINLGDVTNPVLNNVPADVTISCDDAVPNPPNVTAFDECPGIFMDFDESSSQHYAGACESYTITRTWIATDLCGNQASQSQNITVIDNAKPEIFQVYTLENGKRVVAGVSKNVTHDWKYIPFPVTFGETPMIFTTVVTNRDMAAVTVRQRNAYSQGFEVRLFEQQSADGRHQGEDVAWMAIESGTNDDLLKLEAGRWMNVNNNPSAHNFTNLFGNNPGVMTAMQSTNDTDPATVRLGNVTSTSASLFIQEETSADAEVVHGYEHVGYLAFKPGVDLTDYRGAAFGETGKMNLTNAWATITLKQAYTKPVVVFGGISSNDAQGANVRVRNVTGNSFEVRLQEWDYLDGNHGTESVSWLVMEGSIPGNMSYYCSGSVSDLIIGKNVFALDNCDDQTAFGYTETPSVSSSGTMTARVWMAIDDCGNTNLITRFDTCSTAALQVRAMLHGANINNGNTGLMRDDLRKVGFVPIEEPFSSLPAFPHVEDTTPQPTGQNGNNGNNGDTGKVLVCHKPGTPSEKTLEINENALQAHLNHGDVEGSCSGGVNDPPVGSTSAYYKTIADGNWEDASTWENGLIPPSNNINGKTISICHHVNLSSNKFTLKGGSTLWVVNGGLTVAANDVELKDAEVLVVNSDLIIQNGSLLLSTGTSDVTIQNSTVDISGSLDKGNGHLWVENVCLTVGGNLTHTTGFSEFFNSSVVVNGNFTNSSTLGLELNHTKVKVSTGFFQNNLLANISGDSLIVWVENGVLTNLGTWALPIKQYCVGGSATGLGSLLPIAEDCSGMADYFNTCSSLIAPTIIVNNDPSPTYDAAEIAKSGTLDPVLLDVTGNDAIVDWLLLEIRDPNTEEILEYATVALQRDGDIMSEDGLDVINFPTLLEGDYIVSIRHRNHLALMTDVPMFLSILNTPMIDFTDPGLPVRGASIGGHIVNGVRMMWGGDFNEDNKVIYQGPSNDVFYLFSRALSDPGNTDYLANYIVQSYDLHDFNLDGKVIYQGPNNDRASLLYHTVLAHTGNGGFLANFIARGFLP